MRAIARFALCLMLPLLISGCFPVPSLHPIYQPGEPIFDARLVGQWQNEDGESVFTFSKAGKRSYTVTLAGEAGSVELVGHLIRIGQHAVLDLTAPKLESDQEDERVMIRHLHPVHSFHRIQIQGDSLEFAFLDRDWMAKAIESGKVKIGHTRVQDRLVLTAPTEELRKLVERYIDDDDAFSELDTYRRLRP